jgi:hypothetical protein
LKYSLEVVSFESASSSSSTAAVVPYNLWFTGVQDFIDLFDLREVEDVFL